MLGNQRRRRRQAPAWWLADQAVQASISVGAAYGLQWIQKYGVPDMSPIVEGAGALTQMYGTAQDIATRGPIYTAANAVRKVTAQTIPWKIGKKLGMKERKLSGPHLLRDANVTKAFKTESFEAASFASHSYKQHQNRHSFGNWRYSKSLSDDRIVVHEKHHSGDWHISIRGSDFTNPIDRGWSDFIQDIFVFWGTSGNSDEYNRVHKKVRKLIQIHNLRHGSKNGKLGMSGHSLGGTMIAHMMEDPVISQYVENNGGSAHAFNPGKGPFGPWENHGKHMHIHINNHDPVSLFGQANSGATTHYHEGPLSQTHWHPRWAEDGYWNEYDYSENTHEENSQDIT